MSELLSIISDNDTDMLAAGQGWDPVRVLGQAWRGCDWADRGSDLGRRQQDHYGQAREEHLHPQEPLHRAPGDHRGAGPRNLGEGNLNNLIDTQNNLVLD